MPLKVCPFSIAVFIGTAAGIVYYKQQQQRVKQEQSNDATPDKLPLPKCHVVFVLGAPGVGKGTQCSLLTQRLTKDHWEHLSAGDLLRAERNKSNSQLGSEINACINAGKLVDSKITCKLLENAMKDSYAKNKTTHFLIDGFPRSVQNNNAWLATMSHHQIDCVLDFQCPKETLIGRLLERGKTSGRSDDTLETIQKRFDTFVQETAPILEHYRNETNVPVHTILSDQDVESVYKNTVQYF